MRLRTESPLHFRTKCCFSTQRNGVEWSGTAIDYEKQKFEDGSPRMWIGAPCLSVNMTSRHCAFRVDYRTVSAVKGPLVILDKVKVRQ